MSGIKNDLKVGHLQLAESVEAKNYAGRINLVDVS